MEQFFKLPYDAQWILYYLSSQENQEIPLLDNEKNRTIDLKTNEIRYNFETEKFYPILCDVTKKSLTLENFDEKFKQISNTIYKLINDKILEYSSSKKILKFTFRGDVFLQSQLLNPLQQIAPKNFQTCRDTLFNSHDSEKIILRDHLGGSTHTRPTIVRRTTKGETILKLLRYIQNDRLVRLVDLSQLIVSDNMLTMNFIHFISNLLKTIN